MISTLDVKDEHIVYHQLGSCKLFDSSHPTPSGRLHLEQKAEHCTSGVRVQSTDLQFIKDYWNQQLQVYQKQVMVVYYIGSSQEIKARLEVFRLQQNNQSLAWIKVNTHAYITLPHYVYNINKLKLLFISINICIEHALLER